MQQRYCSCGNMVWVQYICYGNTSVGPVPLEAIFTSLSDGDQVLHTCPSCGQSLNINNLR